MEGVVLVKTAAKFITGSNLNGRILAQTACTLQKATVADQGSLGGKQAWNEAGKLENTDI